jgi:hypothetical protein
MMIQAKVLLLFLYTLIHFNLEKGPTITVLVHIFEWKVPFWEKLKIPYMGVTSI